MKKILRTLIIVLVSAYLWFPIQGNCQAAYVNNYQQSPQSPEAKAFSNYTNVPVSTYTGIPNINIPLCTMESDFLSMPIGLSYHGGGIRVNDIAAWTGQGWNLNIGGMIIRQIKDQPDDACKVNTEIIWCSDAIACRNCVECDADPVACESCPTENYTKVMTQTYEDVGYLHHAQMIEDLTNKDWNAFTAEEKAFVWGAPNDFETDLTFDALNLDSDIIVDIDMAINATCPCSIYVDVLVNEEEDGVVDYWEFLPQSIILNGLEWLFGQLSRPWEELVNDCNGEFTPVMTLEHMLNEYPDYIDCFRFDVMRPTYDFIDTEPDVFTFNVNGHSGKFVFGIDGVPRLFEESDLMIEYVTDCDHVIDFPAGSEVQTRSEFDYQSIYTGAITEFKITDTKGIQYIFRDKDITFGNDENQSVPPLSSTFFHHDNNPQLKDPYRIDFENVNAAYTTWHLSEIRVAHKPASQNLEYLFEYDQELNVDHSFISMTANTCTSNGQLYSYNSSVNTIFKNRLKSVQWKRGGSFATGFKLLLHANTEMQDYYYPAELSNNMGDFDKTKRLDKIQLLKNNHILKEVNFNYAHYIKKEIGSFNLMEKPWMEAHRTRLRLESITEGGYSDDGTYAEKPSYVFDYNDMPVPPRHTCQKDFWGFYNGTSQSFLPHIWAYPLNTNPLSDPINTPQVVNYWRQFNTPYSIYKRTGPTIGTTEYDLGLTYTHGDREVYEEYAKAGVLERITYPTSGYTDFVFESNTFLASQFHSIFDPPKKAGGLRIDTIANSEGVIVNYDYFNGSLPDIPLFARSVDQLSNCNTDNGAPFNSTIISSEGFAGLGLTEGSPVGYGGVVEIFNDNSQTAYIYAEVLENEADRVSATFPNNYQYDGNLGELECGDEHEYIYNFPDFFHTVNPIYEDYYPFPPKPNYDWKRNKLKMKVDKNSEGLDVNIEEYIYTLRCADKINGIKSLQNLSSEEQLLGIFQVSSAKYNYLSVDYKLTKIIKDLDAVHSETEFGYDDNFNHNFIVTESTENSDGKVHIKENLYPSSDCYASESEYQDMITQNRIESLGFTQETSGLDYNGEKSYYKYFGENELYGPYLEKIETYDFGTNQSGSQETKMTIDDMYGTIGKVKQMHVEGWEPEDFTYDASGNLKTRTFDNFTWGYEYFDNTNLLKSITDIDGQVSSFTYDGLQRLTNTSERNGLVTTDILYNFGPNFIETTRKYGSDVELVTKDNFDGLGRLEETEKVDYAQGGGDVSAETIYNDKGQIWKQGDFAGFFTTYEYHPDPLNRIKSVTLPRGNVTTTTYGSNESEHPSYNTGLLYKEESIDPDGIITTSFSDRLGRNVLSVRSDDNEQAKTFMEYDDKGRLELVIPPDAIESDEGLLYRYTYGGDDVVLSKQFPDRGITNYAYDLRNLQIGMRDPLLSSKGYDWLANEYDNHGRIVKSGFGTISNGFPSVDDVLIQNYYDGTGTGETDDIYKGKMDKSEINILQGYDKGPDNLTRTFLIDEFGRTDTMKVINPFIGDEQFDYTYDMADNVLSVDHQTPVTNPIITNAYDLQGRLSSTNLAVDGENQDIVGDFVYLTDDLIQSKNLRDGQETVNYLYNQNRWLKRISVNTNVSANGVCFGTDPTNLLDMFYYYNQPNQTVSNIPRYNGNISSISETQAGIGQMHYAYEYDFLNRLTKSTSSDDNAVGTDYTYHDKRGNIGTIKRNGYLVDGECYRSDLIDDMELTYFPGTNLLKRVTDHSLVDDCPDTRCLNDLSESGDYGTKVLTKADGIVDSESNIQLLSEIEVRLEAGFSFDASSNGSFVAKLDDCPEINLLTQSSQLGYQGSGTADYQYDANRNIKWDPNKELFIAYNYLNLPFYVSRDSENLMVFTYAADGTKLRKASVIESVTTIKDYYGEVETTDGDFDIHHSEGRVLSRDGNLSWQYYLKDHLGNTRVVYEADEDGDGEVDIVQNNKYYPFGMQMEGPWNDQETVGNDYTYNGKEINRELGLNWMDYGARYYDPSIGRFNSVDPLSDIFPQQSHYLYAYNNPSNFIDVYGLYGDKSEASQQRQMALDAGHNVGDVYQSGDEWGFNIIDGENSSSAFKKDFGRYADNTTSIDNLSVNENLANGLSDRPAIGEGFTIWGINPYGSLIDGEEDYGSATAMDMPTMPRLNKDQRSMIQFYKSLEDKVFKVFDPTLVPVKGGMGHVLQPMEGHSTAHRLSPNNDTLFSVNVDPKTRIAIDTQNAAVKFSPIGIIPKINNPSVIKSVEFK